jgi:LacI family transcriptional regulator
MHTHTDTLTSQNPKQVTITDVARAAGVGVGTVSRVINEEKGVSLVMAQRVRAVMSRIGYRPALPAFRPGPRRRLNAAHGKRTARVELVIMFPLGLGWMEDQAPVYSSTIDAIEAALSKQGIDLIVRQTRVWPELLISNTGEMLGRIYFGTPEADEIVPPDQFHLPSVWVMGTPPLDFVGDHVLGDHLATGQLAARRLLDLGHTNCMYLGTILGSPTLSGGYRADGFRHEIEQAGGISQLVIDPRIVQLSRQAHLVDQPRLQRLLLKVLRSDSVPTALCLQSDMLAPAVYEILTEMGVRPQRDITIITCDNEAKYQQVLNPAPLVVDIRTAEIARQAVDTLLWRRQHPACPALRILIRPTLPM